MFACIDLGSNSFHLLIAEWQDGESQIVERFSNIVQLGEGVSITGEISPAAFRRGMDCLQEFAQVMARYPIGQYWALGTNALRLARNAPEFLAGAAEIGLEVSVITGNQEAILVYSGVLSALPHSQKNRLVIDIGGGSTEVIIGQQEKRFFTRSFPVGCVSWRDRFFSVIPDNPDALEQLLDRATAQAADAFAALGPQALKTPWDEAYASSGTAKMLAAVCQESGYGDGSISIASLEALKPDVLACASEPDLLLPGLKDRRKDLLMPGWAVLMGLMQACSLRSLNFSPTALREGMLDFMMRTGADTMLLEKDSLPDVTQTEL